MYDIALFVHSVNRWIVLALTIAAVGMAIRPVATMGPHSNADSALKSALRGVSGIQALLGSALYVVLSPLTRLGWAAPSQIGSNAIVRYWIVMHGPLMLLAVALIHAERGRRSRLASLALLAGALACILVAMPWPAFDYGRRLLPSP